MNDRDTITSKQLVFIIIGAQVATGVFSLPHLASTEAGQDAWLAVLLGAMTPLLALLVIERLGRRMPEAGFVGMNYLLFGRWLGAVMVFLFTVYAVFFQAVVVRIFAEITNIFLLPRTPLPVIVLLVLIGAVYVINKGARVVARVNEILFWVVLPLLFLLMIPLVNADYTNLLPVGEAGLAGIARGALTSSYSYAGIEILLVFYFLVGRKEEIIKAGLLGLGFTATAYLVVTLVCLLVWGQELLQIINWPVLRVLKTIKFALLERPEFFMLAVWMGLGVRPTMNMGFAVSYALSVILHVDRSKYFHLVVLSIALLIYITALLPADIIVAFKWSDYAGYSFWLAGLFYPLIMLVAAIIRGKKAQNE
ncbi:GerAB/ArcD/ProY family transporter [Syntrophomonas curvata]